MTKSNSLALIKMFQEGRSKTFMQKRAKFSDDEYNMVKDAFDVMGDYLAKMQPRKARKYVCGFLAFERGYQIKYISKVFQMGEVTIRDYIDEYSLRAAIKREDNRELRQVIRRKKKIATARTSSGVRFCSDNQSFWR